MSRRISQRDLAHDADPYRFGEAMMRCEGYAPGTRNRVRAEVYDGEFMRFRWCVQCCFGMAVYNIRPSILDARIERARQAA